MIEKGRFHYEQVFKLAGCIFESSEERENQCNIFLTNGYQFKGFVKGFDNYVVILSCDGKQQLVYKHAISTIVPAHAVPLLDNIEEFAQADATNLTDVNEA